MRGLKTQEGSKFERFFQLVQDEAAKSNAVFFLLSGEGRDIILPNLEGEDLSGWLIPADMADEFEEEWKDPDSSEHLDKWDHYFMWAEWSEKNGVISVQFNSYE